MYGAAQIRSPNQTTSFTGIMANTQLGIPRLVAMVTAMSGGSGAVGLNSTIAELLETTKDVGALLVWAMQAIMENTKIRRTAFSFFI